MRPGQQPGRNAINARKVPAPGEAVNDGLHTAWRVRGGTAGPARRVDAEFYPGMEINRTNRRSFLVYQNGPANITMVGTPAESRKTFTFLNTGWFPMDTSHLVQHAGTAGALFASIFVVATTTMKTMTPLRVFGILANVVLIVTAIPSHNYLVMGVQAVMLYVNSYRLHQMLQLVRDVKKSVNSDLSMEWLKPFMTERQCAAGEILFYKDEKAEDMLYIVSGRFRLVESGIALPVGAIVGELGMLSPSNMRTQTLECVEAGLVLSVSYSKVEELYVQNPAFGFYFLRLSSARLFQNIDTLEQRVAQRSAAAAEAKRA